ncbi:Enoyl-CoA hydratase / 3-hydroxyacyl-CoA dehydrogenase / 3-hydroxybutyryl-CoA epimerase [hydrothermal vent metagenome]|uniref:enoyl-CoA hydratase n=1 Tax=hydrothermal vent metagenome TaxID=652676 RepID=A0A3B1B7V8_9ZZZZ
MTDETYTHWQLEQDDENVVWLALDKADSSTNTLSATVLTELEAILNHLHHHLPRGLVIRSAKENGFIAGADIGEFTHFETQHTALEAIQRGQRVFKLLEDLNCTTIALIHGYCLGGGMELALACHYRVAEDNPDTRLGLPEVRLGIHPGFGGTVRSLEAAGPLTALNIMLTGRSFSARAAKKMRLVDYAVPKRHLFNAARSILRKPSKKKPLPRWLNLLNHKLLRPWIAKYMVKTVAKKAARAHYPAPYALIDLWQHYADDREQMLREEAVSVASLLVGKTAQNLIRVFKLQETLKSLGRTLNNKPKYVHVIGGGVMGGDIAAWCTLQGYHVSIQDREHETLGRVIKRAYILYKKRLKVPRLVATTLDRLMPDLPGHALARADVVIEAIFEDAEVKRQLFREIEPQMKTAALLCTNTSSIPLEELAEALEKPERLVGLHFFNPVAKMPLIEIVCGKNSSDENVQRANAFAKSISRLPLPVSSSPGFLVNRVLMPYLIEAVILAEEGVPLKVIDDEAVEFGMPMGPIELADTVGLDICLKVADILSQNMDISVPDKLKNLVTRGKLGKKSGQGFYTFKKGKPIKTPADKDYTPPTDIQERLILRMVNEVIACLHDGVIENADLADAGIIFGTGFAPFRGGPMRYLHDRGVQQVHKMLEQLQQRYGQRFAPDAGWQQWLEADIDQDKNND